MSKPRIVRDAIGQLNIDEALDQRARHLLESIDSAQIDATLEAHVDRNAAIDALPLSTISPEASALLLMLVRHNESGRRMLPTCAHRLGTWVHRTTLACAACLVRHGYAW